MDSLHQSFSQIIRGHLIVNGLTQRDFAAMLEINEDEVCRVLNGRGGLSTRRAWRWGQLLDLELRMRAHPVERP